MTEVVPRGGEREGASGRATHQEPLSFSTSTGGGGLHPDTRSWSESLWGFLPGDLTISSVDIDQRRLRDGGWQIDGEVP